MGKIKKTIEALILTAGMTLLGACSVAEQPKEQAKQNKVERDAGRPQFTNIQTDGMIYFKDNDPRGMKGFVEYGNTVAELNPWLKEKTGTGFYTHQGIVQETNHFKSYSVDRDGNHSDTVDVYYDEESNHLFSSKPEGFKERVTVFGTEKKPYDWKRFSPKFFMGWGRTVVFLDNNAVGMEAYAINGNKHIKLKRWHTEPQEARFEFPKGALKETGITDFYAVDRNGNKSKTHKIYTLEGHTSLKPFT